MWDGCSSHLRSTHFADTNLMGDTPTVNRDAPPDAARRVGFLASPEGRQHLEDQRAFWRSIATWLSQPGELNSPHECPSIQKWALTPAPGLMGARRGPPFEAYR